MPSVQKPCIPKDLNATGLLSSVQARIHLPQRMSPWSSVLGVPSPRQWLDGGCSISNQKSLHHSTTSARRHAVCDVQSLQVQYVCSDVHAYSALLQELGGQVTMPPMTWISALVRPCSLCLRMSAAYIDLASTPTAQNDRRQILTWVSPSLCCRICRFSVGKQILMYSTWGETETSDMPWGGNKGSRYYRISYHYTL